MKNLKIIFASFILLTFVTFTFSQIKTFGTVTEIVDGRTIIVEPQPNVKINVQLQYIEVPEAEQELHDVVKSHLKNLLLGKRVEFASKNFNQKSEPIGQVFLNGVDVSQQMLRDGAAWYFKAEGDLQNEVEGSIYQRNEMLAKNEKRGVWSIPDLKPAWSFRAEKEEKRKKALKAEQEATNAKLLEQRERAKPKNNNRATAANNTGVIWADVYGYNFLDKKIPNVFTEYLKRVTTSNSDPIEGFDETSKWGYVATPITQLVMRYKGKSRYIYVAMINFYKNENNKVENYHVIRFYSESNKEILSLNQTLEMILHIHKVTIRPTDYLKEKKDGKIREMLEFGIPPKIVEIMKKSGVFDMRSKEYIINPGYFSARVHSLLN